MEHTTEQPFIERRRGSAPIERKSRPPYGIILIVAIFGFWAISKSIIYYSDVISNIKTNSSVDVIAQQQLTKTVSDLSVKIDLVLGESMIYQKNTKAFAINKTTEQCATCHLRPNMYLLKSGLRFTEFKDYVRGTKRHIMNNEMPLFTDSMIKDEDLEKMYLILKQ